MTEEKFDKILEILKVPHQKNTLWYETAKGELAKYLSTPSSTERVFSLEEMIGAMLEGEVIGDQMNPIYRKRMREKYFKEKFGIELPQ